MSQSKKNSKRLNNTQLESEKNNFKIFWNDICNPKLELNFFNELVQQFIFYNLIIYICLYVKNINDNFYVNYLCWFGLLFSTSVVFLYIVKLACFISLIFGVNLKKIPKNYINLFALIFWYIIVISILAIMIINVFVFIMNSGLDKQITEYLKLLRPLKA